MKIFKEFTFEAAHRLPNLPKAHKCYHLHGHNYRVRVECEGPLHKELGWVFDFGMIDAAMGELKQIVDHKYLNDIDGLENPTAELIAQWFLDRARLTIIPVKSVTVWETPDCGAIAE
jgi:6-pyruvoyltetrahydropterin/6-carboxytetrahydropterin synthase